MRVAARNTKRTVAIILAAVLVVAVVLAAATSGLGPPAVPSGDVAIVDGVDNGTVSQEEFDAGLEQAAAQLGLKEVPPVDDPQYQGLLDQTMQSLLVAIWVRGEATDRGITVSQDEIASELASIKKQSFSSEQEFQQFIKRSKFTDADIQEQVELTLLRDRLEGIVIPSDQSEDPENPGEPLYTPDDLAGIYGVDDDAIKDFYDTNQASFESPATRDVRVILNSSEQQANQAKQALEADDSDQSWKEIAEQFSQDQASKDRGGLLEGLTEGQNDPQLEEQAFSASEGELVGPFETDRGFYVIQVQAINEAGIQPLDQASEAIRQQLISSRQQVRSNSFQSEFVDKWTTRTSCAPEAAIALCRGFEAPEPEPAKDQAFPPPVVAPAPIAPGSATITLDGSAGQGQEQTPRRVGDECATPDQVEAATQSGELQPGQVLEPCGPDDAQPPPVPAAQGIPGGAVPIGPGGAPSGAAPPAAAAPPTGAAPPAGAAPPPAP